MKPARRLPGDYAAGLLGAGELIGNPLRRSPRCVRRRRRVCGDHVRAVQQRHLDDGGDGDGIDRMAGRKGRAGKTQHGVVHVEPVFEPGLSARQPSDALGIGHVDHAMRDEYTRLRQRSLRQRLHSPQEADERDCRIGGAD